MSTNTQTQQDDPAADTLVRQRQQIVSAMSELDALAFLEQHTRLIDAYFRKRFENSLVGPNMRIDKNPYAFIALGGYGRGEQCLHSDVDLLFLFKKNVPETAENLIREIVYPLWDLGFEVGYATRSLKECLHLAGNDFEILTPLLDARFICGVSLLYSELIESLHKKVLNRRKTKVVKWLIDSNHRRHVHFGDSTYRLEPNLKEGQGGLRDYHTMLWLARIHYQVKHPRDLEYFGHLSHREYAELRAALSFIWNVRNRLHMICRRKCDQLHFENQIKLADTLAYEQTNGQKPVEQFLGELHGKMEFIKQQHLMLLYELGYMTKGKPRRLPTKTTDIPGLAIDRAALNFISSEAVLQTPLLLLHIFEESLRLKLPLSAEAKRIVREFAYLVDDGFRNNPQTIKSFERILLSPAPTFNVLKEMLNSGFLIRFIPEFKMVANRIQYDEYHLYPVDKHLLRAVQTVKNFGTDDGQSIDPLCTKIYKEMKNRKALLWAALLHDIGKGLPDGDHSKSGAAITRDILAARGLKPKDIDTVAFLVEHHLFLIKTATRRDIHHEETAIYCARKIESVDRLKMLYLLTAADSVATGPKAWNDWTATLLRDLFLKVLNILEHGELATREAVRGMEKKRAKVLVAAMDQSEYDEISALFDILSPRYLLYATSDQILEDMGRYKRLGDKPFVWNVTRAADSETRTVKICAQDRPGLFSKIAGVFTLNNIDIIDAQIFTWRNRVAVDIFEVKPPPDQLFEEDRWTRAAQHLVEALDDKLDLAAALGKKLSTYRRKKKMPLTRPNRVNVDNHSSSFFTIVEVTTYDYPGLLFNITDALFSCSLDIWVAKIATRVDQVVDVFYVRDFDGQKVDRDEQVEKIKATIETRLVQTESSSQATPS